MCTRGDRRSRRLLDEAAAVAVVPQEGGHAVDEVRRVLPMAEDASGPSRVFAAPRTDGTIGLWAPRARYRVFRAQPPMTEIRRFRAHRFPARGRMVA